jgi:hypothetical protein
MDETCGCNRLEYCFHEQNLKDDTRMFCLEKLTVENKFHSVEGDVMQIVKFLSSDTRRDSSEALKQILKISKGGNGNLNANTFGALAKTHLHSSSSGTAKNIEIRVATSCFKTCWR